MVNDKEISFSCIFDKVYRVNLPAMRAGTQEALQSIFARSDCKFTGQETIHTALVATDCSGNEGAVNQCKESGYLKRKLQENGKPALLDSVWLSWLFQTNFMYKPVL